MLLHTHTSLCVALLFSLTLTACAEDPITVRYAPGLARAARHVSVFGIRRDGLMSRSGWAALGPYASAPFSEEPCDVGYSDSTFTEVPELADAIDDYVRENGVTDALLDQIAAAAKGDMIMVFTVAGHPLASVEDPGGAAYQRSLPPTMGSGGGGRRGSGRSRQASQKREEPSNGDAFEISASFFSIREHRAVAQAKMRYSGPNTDKALTQFTNRLEREFPGSTCSGWDWSVHVDETKIRKLSEQ
jgi:hypothetical protein